MLPFALLAGSPTFAASTPSKIWSTVTTSVVPQHVSPTAVHSASSGASLNDSPTPPPSRTVRVPTTVETPPLLIAIMAAKSFTIIMSVLFFLVVVTKTSIIKETQTAKTCSPDVQIVER